MPFGETGVARGELQGRLNRLGLEIIPDTHDVGVRLGLGYWESVASGLRRRPSAKPELFHDGAFRLAEDVDSG